LLEYIVVVSVFQEHGIYTHTLQARSGPGISDFKSKDVISRLYLL